MQMGARISLRAVIEHRGASVPQSFRKTWPGAVGLGAGMSGSMTAWSSCASLPMAAPRPLPASPFLLLPLPSPLPSLFFSFSPHLLLSFPPLFSFPLLLPLPFSPSSYLIPLVFLLAACPADLHACCVEAAQLDLMPPAARSRAGSGLGAALPGRGREHSVPPQRGPCFGPFPHCLLLFILSPSSSFIQLLSCFHHFSHPSP